MVRLQNRCNRPGGLCQLRRSCGRFSRGRSLLEPPEAVSWGCRVNSERGTGDCAQQALLVRWTGHQVAAPSHNVHANIDPPSCSHPNCSQHPIQLQPLQSNTHCGHNHREHIHCNQTPIAVTSTANTSTTIKHPLQSHPRQTHLQQTQPFRTRDKFPHTSGRLQSQHKIIESSSARPQARWKHKQHYHFLSSPSQGAPDVSAQAVHAQSPPAADTRLH